MLRATLQRWILIAGLWIGAMGCAPSGDSALDEEKDSYYLVGMSRKQTLDYAGAVEAFERALERNPRSAAAHFELGLICYQNVSNWAGAIHHFEQFCRLKPDSNKTDAARQFVAACKQELVREVPLGSISQQLQKEFARLSQENKELRQQVEQLRQQLAQRPAPAGGDLAGPAAGPPFAPSPPPPSPAATDPPIQSVATPPPRVGSPTPAPFPLTHTVKAGETVYGIARRYRLQTSELLAANPGVEPRRLAVGHVLNIPRP